MTDWHELVELVEDGDSDAILFVLEGQRDRIEQLGDCIEQLQNENSKLAAAAARCQNLGGCDCEEIERLRAENGRLVAQGAVVAGEAIESGPTFRIATSASRASRRPANWDALG